VHPSVDGIAAALRFETSCIEVVGAAQVNSRHCCCSSSSNSSSKAAAAK